MFGCERILDDLKNNSIVGIFGKMRSGKTTILAGIAKENNKRKAKGKGLYYDRVYCTDVTIKGTIPFTWDEFGTWEIQDNSLLLVDEAGLLVNNRHWKNMTDGQKEDIAFMGHYKSCLVWSSQRSDIDVNLLERTHVMYIVNRFTSSMSFIKTIKYDIDVDNEQGVIINKYHKPEGLREIMSAIIHHEFKVLYRPQYYKCFNSYTRNKRKVGLDPETKQKIKMSNETIE